LDLYIFILTSALVIDVKSGRVPNWLTMSGLLTSQLVLLLDSCETALKALVISLLIVLILFPVFAIGGLGAGDIKLMMILPCYFSFNSSLHIILYSFLVAAVIGAFGLIFSGKLIYRISRFLLYLKNLIHTGELRIYDSVKSSPDGQLASNQIHFTLPIFVSVMLVLGGVLNV